MPQAYKSIPRTRYVTGDAGGQTFVEYGIPGGGKVSIMDSETLKKAIRKTSRSIRVSIEKIQRRHGVNE